MSANGAVVSARCRTCKTLWEHDGPGTVDIGKLEREHSGRCSGKLEITTWTQPHAPKQRPARRPT